MSSQDSIKTSAADLSPSVTGMSDESASPQPDSPPGSGSGSRGVPPEDWGLPIGSPFPSAENPKYIIKAEIDDGGMGVVYEAHQGELGIVAIKVIKPRILSQAASERFLNEARAMAKVRTEPGIATIFDCDWYTDPVTKTRAPFIVMEYVPGALSITSYASEHKLSQRARLELFQKVCEAVAAAHRADIIHRDLKPSNVMVDAAGHPKVIDFGLALVRDPAEHARRLPSERGGLFGTLEYMSPEQAAKKFDPHVLTAASDVYSLGVILYELLLGQLPYQKHPADSVRKTDGGVPDYSEATRIIREEPPIPPHRLNRAIHPAVEAILLKALEKEPANRYRSAEELSAAIARHLKWGRKRDAALAAPIVILASWLAGIIAIPTLFNLAPVSDWYRKAVGAVAPAIDEFTKVVLVTVDEKTDISKFGELDTEDMSNLGFGANMRTRPMIGALCKRLATSGCRVVALDLYYPEAKRADDDALIRGALTLHERNPEPIGWVMLVSEWPDYVAKHYPATLRAVKESKACPGAPWLVAEPTGWKIEAALERGTAKMPSFSLAAAAAYRYPGQEIVYRFDDLSFSVFITAIGKKGQIHDKEPFAMSRVIDGGSDEAQRGLERSEDRYKPGDRLAILGLPPFPSDRAFEEATIRADELMTDEQQLLRCRDKVVVIANLHEDFKQYDEWAPTPDGRMVPKGYAHALAIETLLRGKLTLRELDRNAEIIVTLLAAGVGALIAAACSGSMLRACGVGVLTAGGMFGLSLLLANSAKTVFNPIVPTVAMCLAIVFSLAAPFVFRTMRRRRPRPGS